jgi:phosphate transport system substrate-binding protein
MNLFKFPILLLFLVLLSGCRQGNTGGAPDKIQEDISGSISGRFSISGAYALFPLISKWADDFMKMHPGVEIDIVKNGTGQGIDDIRTGKSQLAMISRPLTDEEIENGIWTISVAKEGVAPITNSKNPYLPRLLNRGLSPDDYQKAFINGKSITWAELLDTVGKEKVIVYIRADESGAADVFADFLYATAIDLKGNKVTGDDEMIKSVQANPFALGFCNYSFAFDPSSGERKKDIQIIPSDLDFDNKIDRKEIPFNSLDAGYRAIWLGIYPKVLCRELTIGSIGKPEERVIVEFLRYLLTEGQENVQKTGLCELNSVYVKYSLDKLE